MRIGDIVKLKGKVWYGHGINEYLRPGLWKIKYINSGVHYSSIYQASVGVVCIGYSRKPTGREKELIEKLFWQPYHCWEKVEVTLSDVTYL